MIREIGKDRLGKKKRGGGGVREREKERNEGERYIEERSAPSPQSLIKEPFTQATCIRQMRLSIMWRSSRPQNVNKL